MKEIKTLYGKLKDKKAFCEELSKEVQTSPRSLYNHWFGSFWAIPEKHQDLVLKKLKERIMNPDDYIEGTFDSENPANISEIEVESEEVEPDYKALYKQEKQRKEYKIWQLKKLAELHQVESWGMSLTYEQQSVKLEIINQYL